MVVLPFKKDWCAQQTQKSIVENITKQKQETTTDTLPSMPWQRYPWKYNAIYREMPQLSHFEGKPSKKPELKQWTKDERILLWIYDGTQEESKMIGKEEFNYSACNSDYVMYLVEQFANDNNLDVQEIDSIWYVYKQEELIVTVCSKNKVFSYRKQEDWSFEKMN